MCECRLLLLRGCSAGSLEQTTCCVGVLVRYGAQAPAFPDLVAVGLQMKKGALVLTADCWGGGDAPSTCNYAHTSCPL